MSALWHALGRAGAFVADPPGWFSAAWVTFTLTLFAGSFWVSRQGWQVARRYGAELRRVYAHRLVVTAANESPDRDTAALYVDVWQAVAIATYGGRADDAPIAAGNLAVWFMPPAPSIERKRSS